MNYVGVKQLRQELDKYVKRVQKGERFTVMKHNQPLFQMAPVEVDEWGDEGEWETVIDFRKINPHGVPFEDVLKAFEKLREEEKARKKQKRG